MLHDGRLEDIAVDRDDLPRAGAVHLARIGRLAPKMRAAFIDLGNGVTGLLRAGDVRPRPPVDAEIGAVLRAGEPVLVQVRAIQPANKAPTVSMDIALPGRLLVHLPLGRGITVSRRVTDPAERARLAEMPGLGQAGWIVRARGAAADANKIETEAAALAKQWSELSARIPGAAAPARLTDGPNAPIRLLIEGAGLPDRVEIFDRAVRGEVERWAADQPLDLGPAGSPNADLFTLRDLHERFAELLRPAVALPSGGAIVIEPTAALTAIDVDTGGRCTPVQANLEAAREIARQIRLRQIGGIVVVDFVTMRRDADRKNLLSTLGQAVSQDPVPTHLYGMSALGLVELVRERRGLPLSQLLTPPSP